MILVVGTFRLPIANLQVAREAMERIVRKSRNETGCIDYAYAEDSLDPGLFRVSEAWQSREALAAHFASPHMQAWRHEREALGLTDRTMKAYTISGEEVL